MINFQNITIFGGTGFIGSYILKDLLKSNFKPTTLVRSNSVNKLPATENINIVKGNLDDLEIIKKSLKYCDVIIYAVGIIREYRNQGIIFEKIHYEYFKNIVDIAKENKVRKIIYISANGAKEEGTGYQTSKYLAEQYLQNNFDNWTIFRPSIVFGNPGRKFEFITQLYNDIIKKPIPAPLFFKINPFKSNEFFRSNPVHINNLAELIVKSINRPSASNKIYAVGGPIQTTWKSMLKMISKSVEKSKIYFPVPIGLVQFLTKITNIFPITSEQIQMLKENNTLDSKYLFEEYDIPQIPFTVENISYLTDS